MKKWSFVLLTAIAFLLTSCATPSVMKSNPAGKVYEDSIQLKNKTIPLPEGEWKVIGRGYKGDGNSYFEVVLLKETKKREMHSSILITIDTVWNSYKGYYPSKYCQRKNVHHVVVKKNARGDAQDCWLINHYRMSVNPERAAIKEAYDYLKTNKITIPKIMIQSNHRFTGKNKKSKYLVVQYYWNPEVEGFDPPADANWATTEWHPLHINKDPKKVEYIERLKREEAIRHEKLREGFGA